MYEWDYASAKDESLVIWGGFQGEQHNYIWMSTATLTSYDLVNGYRGGGAAGGDLALVKRVASSPTTLGTAESYKFSGDDRYQPMLGMYYKNSTNTLASLAAKAGGFMSVIKLTSESSHGDMASAGLHFVGEGTTYTSYLKDPLYILTG